LGDKQPAKKACYLENNIRLIFDLEKHLFTSEIMEITIGKRGRFTIPINLRKKLKLEAGTTLKVIETKDGILFKLQRPNEKTRPESEKT
jgi:AbrB family looped-hinge helix DNA binding protein